MRSKNEAIIQEIIDFINNKFFTERAVPSVQEIADKVGMNKSSVSRYLTDMESRGLIYKNGTYFGIETKSMRKVTRSITDLPIVGSIACGTPILAEENIESYLTISGNFLGPGEFFVLRAKGNSMIKADINDGDLVVIKKQPSADEGQIVVALIDNGECTLKRYFMDRRRKKVRLHPENDEMEDMYFDNVQMQGIAVKIIKDIET